MMPKDNLSARQDAMRTRQLAQRNRGGRLPLPIDPRQIYELALHGYSNAAIAGR